MEDIEPLPPEMWFERIEMIANGELKNAESALRHAFHLLQLTPREFRPPEYALLDEESYEALLEAGHLDEAAMRLVSSPTLTVTTASGADCVEVVIRCEILKRAIFGRGDCAASAILQAWAKCLLALRVGCAMSSLETAIRH